MDYQQKIDSLFNTFNNIFDEQKIEESKLKEFVPEVVKEKIGKWKAGKIDAIRKDVSNLRIELKSELNVRTKKIPLLKYPLRNSISDQQKIIGELQRQNAFTFINSAKDRSSIKNEVQFAFDSGSIDYFNSLIDGISLKRPNQVELSTATKEEREFYNYIDKIQKQFQTENNITGINDEIGKLKSSLREVEFIQENLESNELLLPLRKIKEYSSQELLSLNLVNAANKSVQYFSK